MKSLAATNCFLIFAIFFLLMSQTQCSYSLRRNQINFSQIRTFEDRDTRAFIPIPENFTTRLGPEIALVQALRERFTGIKGIDVVDSPEEADFFLIGRLRNYEQVQGASPLLGTPQSAAGGGLGSGQVFSSTFAVSWVVDIEVVEVVHPGNVNSPKRTLWIRQFRKESSFPASQRTYVSGGRLDSGSSSATHINEAREKLLWDTMADELTTQILDQVAQDF